MRKGLLLRAAVALLILAFLVRTGPTVGEAAGDSFYVKNRQPPEPIYEGTVTLYHVVTCRTYQGSVTAFLQERAEAFNRQHFGVRIAVEGMGEQDFFERLSYGRRADMYSFFSGVLYEELLQPAAFTSETALRPGLAVTAYAAPWLFSGYVLAEGGGSSPVAALANRAPTPVMDLRAWGDLQRSGEGRGEASFAGPFTDQVCYMGVDRNTSPERAEWCLKFYDFLLSEPVQRMLPALGAFSVRTDTPCPYGDGLLVKLDRSYETVTVPDPFRYHVHRTKLLEEAEAALKGDEAAKNNFFQRLAIVIGP